MAVKPVCIICMYTINRNFVRDAHKTNQGMMFLAKSVVLGSIEHVEL